MKKLNWKLFLAAAMVVGFNAFAFEGDEDISDLTSAGNQIMSEDSLALELEEVQSQANAGVPDPAAQKPASAFTHTPGERKPASDKQAVKNRKDKKSKAKKSS